MIITQARGFKPIQILLETEGELRTMMSIANFALKHPAPPAAEFAADLYDLLYSESEKFNE